MLNLNENDDYRIKEFLKKDTIIDKKAEMAFQETINLIKETKQEKRYIITMKRWITVAASVLITFFAANSYANANGYDNIFFMIKEIWDDKNISKEDVFYDKDITISYKSFYITDDIEMQVNELQITKGNAKLFLYVKENNDNIITPFKYKVFNENGSKAYEGISCKDKETNYREILKLTNYIYEQDKIILQILTSKDKLIKTVTIDLKEKIIEARTENVEVKKISQIKLNSFLINEMNKMEDNYKTKNILILKITDIEYSNSEYVVRYLYTKVTDEEIANNTVEDAEIYEGEARFKLVQNEFELLNLELNKENL